MAKAKLYSKDGSAKSEVELPQEFFSQEVNLPAIHEVITVYRGNQRQGTAKTKGRSEVSGTNQKPWKQKGTGRARAGSNKSPVWVRGGKAHGATPRDYTRDLNKKFKSKVFRSALSYMASEQKVHVFEELSLSAPKTKELAGILSKAELNNKKNIMVTHETERNLFLAARNLATTELRRVEDLNTYDVMYPDNLIFTQAALGALSEKRG
jgi:large subunit ribosomal protein L4